MKSLIISILFLLSVPAMAQSDRFYTTSGGEWIFSFADLSRDPF
jgi:competence protein ComGC